MDKKLVSFIKKHGRLPKSAELKLLGLPEKYYMKLGGREVLLEMLKKEHPDLHLEVHVEKRKEKITQIYEKLVKDLGRHPSSPELIQSDVTESAVRHNFGGFTELKKYMIEHKPHVFKNIFTDEEFTEERFLNLQEDVKNYKRFVISTAISGCKTSRSFHRNIKKYCREKNALLLLIPNADPVSNRSRMGMNMTFDSALKEEHFVFNDLKLNNNFYVSGLKLQAKHINPFTGLQRIARQTGNFIYGSPKQSLEFVASEKFPTALMTPGAITEADYSSFKYISNRTAYIADKDHKLGAYIVEIEDDEEFHFRPIQANSDGEFVDLGILYGTSKRWVDSLFSMGDLHSWTRDKRLVNGPWKEIVQELKCSKIALHDTFDGVSVNPHVRGQNLKRAKVNVLIEDELDELAATLKEMKKWRKGLQLYRIISNHDIFLDRYIDSGDYVREPGNARIGHELWLAKYDGNDPLKYSLDKRGLTDIIHIGYRDSLVFGGIECGKHGHKGANGAKGNKQSHEKSYVNSVTGHEHTPGIRGGAYVNGTSTGIGKDAPDYAEGASSWLQSSTVVYETGHRQLITSINYKWRLRDDK